MNDLPTQIWRASTGQIPFYDHPNLSMTLYQHNSKPLRLDEIVHYINIGYVDEGCLFLSHLIYSFRCISEKQIRWLARHRFAKTTEIANRLRSLRKIGWLESLIMEDKESNQKETIWWLGYSAGHYFQLQGLTEHLQDPMPLLRNNWLAVSLSAVNNIRAWFEDRDLLQHSSYCPVWPKKKPPQPFSTLTVKTIHGPLTLYVERLSQSGKPISYMQLKLHMYEEMLSTNGSILPAHQGDGSAMVVWSVGSLQAIEEIVSSMDYISEAIPQSFIVDERLDDFPNAFYLAQKTNVRGEVLIEPLSMDLF